MHLLDFSENSESFWLFADTDQSMMACDDRHIQFLSSHFLLFSIRTLIIFVLNSILLGVFIIDIVPYYED